MVPRQRAAERPTPSMTDVVAFLRARLDEAGHLGWHDADCHGVPGPSGSCCEARAMGLRQAQTIRQRIARYERAAAQAGRGQLEAAEFWKGAETSLWAEVRADAALWRRHAEYRAEWKDPAASGSPAPRLRS